MQFDQFKYDNGTQKDVTLMCRFVDASTNAVIDKPANMTKMTNYEQKCIAPKTDSVADARVEISANGQQW